MKTILDGCVHLVRMLTKETDAKLLIFVCVAINRDFYSQFS